jgi:HAD superfamily phosphoserine phosphatase-like hydrolase
MSKLAIFDLDGTLSRGFVSRGFLEYLNEAGACSEHAYAKQVQNLGLYEQGAVSYETWCAEWGPLWAESLKSRSVKETALHAGLFFEGFKKNIYPESFSLVKELAANDYRCVMLTMAANEVASLVANELGIKEVHATRLEVKSGMYTGSLETSLHVPGGKRQAVLELGMEHDLRSSYGFGDSASDVEVLELVGRPVALNGSEGLRRLAESRGWMILDSSNVTDAIEKDIRGYRATSYKKRSR